LEAEIKEHNPSGIFAEDIFTIVLTDFDIGGHPDVFGTLSSFGGVHQETPDENPGNNGGR
jgi:hypothetical protein